MSVFDKIGHWFRHTGIGQKVTPVADQFGHWFRHTGLYQTGQKVLSGIQDFFSGGPEGILQHIGDAYGNIVSSAGENIVAPLASAIGESIMGPLGDILFKLGESQRAYDKQEKELEYFRSLPKQQMQNLIDAGLNPNLIYGQGAQGAAGNYTPNEDKGFGLDVLSSLSGGLGSIMDTIGTFQQLKQVSAGIDQTKETTRAMALKNDMQDWLNQFMGIYTYRNGQRVVNPPHVEFDRNGNVVATGNISHSPKAAEFLMKLGNLRRRNLISQVEYENLLNYLDEQSKEQLNLTKYQGKYIQEQYNRLLDTWSPNTLRMLDFGESLLGDATQLLTRGVAGKGSNVRSSPRGYYNYNIHYH